MGQLAVASTVLPALECSSGPPHLLGSLTTPLKRTRGQSVPSPGASYVCKSFQRLWRNGRNRCFHVYTCLCPSVPMSMLKQACVCMHMSCLHMCVHTPCAQNSMSLQRCNSLCGHRRRAVPALLCVAWQLSMVSGVLRPPHGESWIHPSKARTELRGRSEPPQLGLQALCPTDPHPYQPCVPSHLMKR